VTSPADTTHTGVVPAQGGGSSGPVQLDATVAIVTLGCGRNEVDTDQLAGMLHRDGARVVDDPATAEVVLVNTCTFIAPAKQESIDTVLAACQLKDDGAARAVLVVGCMAQRYPHELAEAIPEADAIVGFDGYGDLPTIVAEVLDGTLDERVVGVGAAHPGSRTPGNGRRDLPLLVVPASAPGHAVPDAPVRSDDARHVPGVPADAIAIGTAGVLDLAVLERPAAAVAPATSQDALDRVPASGPRFPVRRFDGAPWAYLKIASGCDRVCTFCAIPSFRGRFRSRPLDEVLAEAAWLAGNGARELVLVSENTTSWGKDLPGGRDLQPTLLRELAAIDGIARLRLMYLQPAELTPKLLDAIAAEPKVASYFDLSLQHVSGPVVRAMARSGDHERFGQLIARAREADPDAVFRSNFILGFPGETEHDVEVLADFLTEQRLDWVGLFPFSREDGTPSDELPDQVPPEVARERVARISELQERLADDAARRFIGRDLDVLVEEVAGGGGDAEAAAMTVGRSYREAPDTDGEVQLVTVDGTPADLPLGRVVTATVVDSLGVDLVAEVTVAGAGGPRG
jgi:ribosomal protein S12 methylthiotransferase